MAEKEERIVCRVIEKGYACDYCFSRPAHKYYQCSISNNDCTYDVCKQCSLGITRTEAIERMAKGIHFYEWAHDKHFPKWNELNSDIQNDYKNMAEAALNALLEGK